ncbi:MAG TPA: hypothetical protein VIE17_00175 [Methylophilaceae bacterium]|jgi:hypothetical protein
MRCLDWLLLLLVVLLILVVDYVLVYGMPRIDFSHIIYLGL